MIVLALRAGAELHHPIANLAAVDFDHPNHRPLFLPCRQPHEGDDGLHYAEALQQLADWSAVTDGIVGGFQIARTRSALEYGMRRTPIVSPFVGEIDLLSAVYSWSRRHEQFSGKDILAQDGEGLYALLGIPPLPTLHTSLDLVLRDAEAFGRLWHGQSVIDEYALYPVPVYLRNPLREERSP